MMLELLITALLQILGFNSVPIQNIYSFMYKDKNEQGEETCRLDVLYDALGH